MLSLPFIDIKTGQVLIERSADGVECVKTKQVENSYLEHWLKTHQIESSQLWVGKFYGVPDADTTCDRQRLEAEGKYLVFTNGKDGYFADAKTAKLITEGDEDCNIHPIFANNQDSPHNFVAYGSLVLSDGIAATALGSEEQPVKILVIDDEQRSHGGQPLVDVEGKPIPPEQLQKLYDKMGDGTMLLSRSSFERLIEPQEREAIAAQVMAQTGISSDLTDLPNEIPQLSGAMEAIDEQVEQLVQRTVTQFRAASIDFPGEAKGTMTTSTWCDRLGVVAILSTNDIKGDDGRFSEPGIKEVSNFWVSRKSDGQYGEQRVGPQVKGCIPHATLHEFNPRLAEAGAQLAQAAADPHTLMQYYVDRHTQQRQDGADSVGGRSHERDWLYEIGQADQHGLLRGLSKINYELERFLRSTRVDLATAGMTVPSAMAQHHAQLKPWEVCNRDLPDGAIVAYYRSPFPNVGAAAIGINNLQAIKDADPEAFSKSGVAYLNPWTAKNVAITDFDKDANGYFVGYLSRSADLPQRMRAALVHTEGRSPAEQYEAGRAKFAELIAQMQTQQPQSADILPGEYPLAVAELVDRTAPENKPPEIVKQKKTKHLWHEGESRSAAIWRAWQKTANNPTGKVANVGMILQSLALETQYIDQDQKEALLGQITAHYDKLLTGVKEGKRSIPTDAALSANGLPAYHLQERIESIAQVGQQLPAIANPTERSNLVDTTLKQVHDLLGDLVDGPNAMNLQTAVDTAKSSRGIDESLHSFARAIAHKPHHLRQSHKDSSVYLQGKLMPTNTQEPIGWGVQQANQLYQETQLEQVENRTFRGLLPKSCTPEQEAHALAIAGSYNSKVKQATELREQLAQNRPQDQQPTLQVTSSSSGKQVTIERLCDFDPEGKAPCWRSTGVQPNWTIYLEPNQSPSKFNPEAMLAKLQYQDEEGHRQTVILGGVAAHSVREHQLTQRVGSTGCLSLPSPIVQLQPPRAIANDIEAQLRDAAADLREQIAAIPDEERLAYASALWHSAGGMGIVLREFTPELASRLQTIPPITLRGLGRSTNEVGALPSGEYTIRFTQLEYQSDRGEAKTVPAVAIVSESGEQTYGSISNESVRLPPGTLARAQLEVATDGKTAQMQVLEKLDSSAQSEARFGAATIDRPHSSSISSTVQEAAAQNNLPLTIATDGACSGNPGAGGWGAVLLQGGTRWEIGGAMPDTTNNRMEMTAAIEALKCAKAQGIVNRTTPITILSDSQILVNGANGTWKRKANGDLWQSYGQESQGLNLKLEWVKGHAGHAENERADQIATAFAQGEQPKLAGQEPVSDRYPISAGELRQLYKAAQIIEGQSDLAIDLPKVAALGAKLKAQYNQEHSTDGNQKPPDEYRHSSVTLSEAGRQKLEMAIAQATALQAERQMRSQLAQE